MFQSFNSSLLPPIPAEFSTDYPTVNVTVRQLPTGELEGCLGKGELDLGIACVLPDSERIVAILWRREGYRSAAARAIAEMIKKAYGRSRAD